MESTIVTSRTLAVACAKLCDDKKADNIVILDVRKIAFFTDFFVIATTTNERQSKAIAESLRIELKHKGHQCLSNGNGAGSDGRWVLQDFGDVVVHLFNGEARSFYDLESLWADAKTLAWLPKKKVETPAG